jgi:hypothetical protein
MDNVGWALRMDNYVEEQPWEVSIIKEGEMSSKKAEVATWEPYLMSPRREGWLLLLWRLVRLVW